MSLFDADDELPAAPVSPRSVPALPLPRRRMLDAGVDLHGEVTTRPDVAPPQLRDFPCLFCSGPVVLTETGARCLTCEAAKNPAAVESTAALRARVGHLRQRLTVVAGPPAYVTATRRDLAAAEAELARREAARGAVGWHEGKELPALDASHTAPPVLRLVQARPSRSVSFEPRLSADDESGGGAA